MRLEQLEAREVPAIVQTGLPSWLSAGPSPAVNNFDESGIVGPGNPFAVVPDGDPAAVFANPATGPASGLATVPGLPDVLFASGSGGGVWRTGNATAASPGWQPLTDGLPSLSVTGIDIDPANGNRLVAAIGQDPAAVGDPEGDRLGVYISDNALAAFPSFRVASVLPANASAANLAQVNVRSAISRGAYQLPGDLGAARPSYVLAGSNFGLTRSLDAGASFQRLGGTGGLPGNLGTAYSVAADPGNPGRVYALTDAGLFRTDDIAAPTAQWQNVTQAFMQINGFGPNPTQNGKISISNRAGSTDSVVYVAVANETGRTLVANGGFLVSGELASVGYSVNGGAFVQMDLPENAEPQSFQVADASNTTPITITTTTGNPYNNGDRVRVSGVQGNLGANAIFTIANVTANTFTLVGSVGTGNYAGGGSVSRLVGINARGNAVSTLALEADPTNPNIVYIGGDFQNSSGSPGAAIQRGDRTAPRAGGNLVPSPQWTQITGANAANTAPKSGVRDFAVDAFGRLVVATNGGVYARASGLDNTSSWTSANGDLALSEMIAIGYDPLNNVLFGSTNNLGTVSQLGGAGAAGSNFWTSQPGSTRIAEAETTTSPGQSVRYTSNRRLSGTRRQVYDAANNQISNQQVAFLDATTGKQALVGGDLDNSDDSLGRSFFRLNAVDPRLALAGRNSVYEDDNPVGNAGDSVAVVTPAGFAGRLSAVVYGGRVAGVDVPRVAYLGTDSGQLFARGQQDGFQQRPLPGTGSVNAVAVDPDDFRRVYAVRNNSAVYFSADGGFTWTDITQNLFAASLDAQGNPVLFGTDPATGQPVGGLTTAITDLAVFDPTPGGTGGDTTLLAGGRGGVFRFSPGLNPVPGFGWTEFGVGLPNAVVTDLGVVGNRLFAATLGRGAYVIPDISGSVSMAATVQVVGTAGDDTLTVTGDPANPNNVILSDGQGSTLTVGLSNSPSIQLLGLGGADTIQVLATGAAGGGLSNLKVRVVVDAGGDAGDRLLVRDAARSAGSTVSVTAASIGLGQNDTFFGSFPGSGLTYAGLGNGTLELDLGADAPGGNTVNLQSTGAATTVLRGGAGFDAFALGRFAGRSAAEVAIDEQFGLAPNLDAITGRVVVDGRGGSDSLDLNDVAAAGGNGNVRVSAGRVTGLTGGGDGGDVAFSGVGSLNIAGSNLAAVAESFTVDNPDVPLTLSTYAGADRVTVNGASQPLAVNTGSGDDTVTVNAASADLLIVTEDGNDAVRVNAANGPLSVLTGAGNDSVTVAARGSARIDTADGDDLVNVVSAGPLTLDTGAGNDTVGVRAILGDSTVNTGDGNDLIRVGSASASTDDGTLAGILGQLAIDAGTGTNRLVFSDFASATGRDYTVNSDALFGGTARPVTFSATGGQFAQVQVRGGRGDDSFSVFNTTAAGNFLIQGGDGNDTFAFNSKTALGAIRFEGGAGADALAFDPGTSKNLATGVSFDGGGGGDGVRILGRDDADAEDASITLTGPNSGFFTGVGAPFPFNNVAFADFDGRSGANSLTVLDASGLARRVVFTPRSLTSGRFDFDGNFRVGVLNVNAALTYAGTANGSGGPDELTYQGFDDLNLGSNPTAQGGDDIFVTDSQITDFNNGLGEIIPLNIGRDGGAPTLSKLTVLGGNEAAGGDLVGVRGSDDIPIVVDGQGPDRAPGDTLTVVSGGAAGLTGVGFENRPNTRSIYAVGADAGGGPRVRVYSSDTNEVLFDSFVYDQNFTGGVRVATGDVTGDGVPDLVTAAGFGGGPHIRVFDGVTFQLVSEFFAYESVFRGGAFVAVGDLTGGGKAQIITGAGNGGGPLVKVFNLDGTVARSFFAYSPIFRGGVRVASGDVNGDGVADIVTGAGVGGGPHVRVFSGGDNSVLLEYQAYGLDYRGGVYVAAGDADGDGFADIITGPGDNTIPFLTFRSSLNGGALVQLDPFVAVDNAAPAPVPPSVAAPCPWVGK